MRFYIRLLFARNLESLVAIADEYVFQGSLEKIIEMTYSYRELDDGNILNETLFEEYLGLSYSDYSIDYLGRRYRYKIKVQIVLIDDILKKTRKIKVESRSDSLKRGLFIEALEYVKIALEISVEGLEFEMQKAGFPLPLRPVAIRKKISRIEKREKLLFGPKVIESSEEFSFCFNFIERNHEVKKKILNDADCRTMRKSLKIIKKSAKCNLMETPDIKKKFLKGSFLKKEILRKDYRRVFDAVCELYGLPQRTRITNAGSIYDGDNFLEIPRGDVFASFPIARLLKLLTHEIESHYINAYNGKILIGSFRGAKNLPKEEGLAMFMERIFNGYNYENIDNIAESFFAIMSGECLPGDQFKGFMRIMGHEYKNKADYRSSVIRAKRNYPFDYVGVQHKDVVYFRGLSDTVKYLKEGGRFSSLFLGKVGFHDIDNIHDIFQAYESKQKLVFPIFISDLIYYYFTNKEVNPGFIFSSPEYYLYLKKKYWFIDLETFDVIKNIDRDWKKIESVLKILKKII